MQWILSYPVDSVIHPLNNWGQVGEVTCSGSFHLSCKRDQIKMRDWMDWRVTAPPCKQVFSWRRNESHFTLGILLGILQRHRKYLDFYIQIFDVFFLFRRQLHQTLERGREQFMIIKQVNGQRHTGSVHDKHKCFRVCRFKF